MTLTADYTVITLCNGALQHLQHDTIADIDDDEVAAARHCKFAYPRVIDALLRDFSWNFAKVRAELAADGTPPAFGYSHRYALPSDCLMVRSIDGFETEAWEVEGRFILINADSPIRVSYTKRITDPAQFDPLFTQLAEMHLAIKVAPMLARDEGLVDRLMERLQMLRRKAQMADGAEARREMAKDEYPYLRLRRGMP